MLQIRRANRDNLGIISHCVHKNIFCYPLLEQSLRDGSNEGVTIHVFIEKYEKLSLNYPHYFLLSGALGISKMLQLWHSVLQMRRANRDNLGIISHCLHENILCYPSLKQSCGDRSNEGVTIHVFIEKYEKLSLNYPHYSVLSGALGISKMLQFKVFYLMWQGTVRQAILYMDRSYEQGIVLMVYASALASPFIVVHQSYL